MRGDSRKPNELRPISIKRSFTQTPAGSVLWTQGSTVVLCTVSTSVDLPPWFNEQRAGGWATAEYVMLPGSTPQRKPWPKIGHTDSRGTEIQRLIGRSLKTGKTDSSELYLLRVQSHRALIHSVFGFRR